MPSAVDTLMCELENLGHRTMAQPGGLAVRLRDYQAPHCLPELPNLLHFLNFPLVAAQLATVAFMVDQERLPGGIQRHLYAPVKPDPRGPALWCDPALSSAHGSKQFSQL